MRSAGTSIHSSSQGQGPPVKSGTMRPSPSASGCEVMIMVRKNSCASTVETFYLDNVNISYQSTSTQPVLLKAGYRYGFNGQEKDNEVSGEGNTYAFEYRIHDARIGRFMSVDPLFREYPYLTSYQCAENRPVDCLEFEGLEGTKDHRYFLPSGLPVFRLIEYRTQFRPNPIPGAPKIGSALRYDILNASGISQMGMDAVVFTRTVGDDIYSNPRELSFENWTTAEAQSYYNQNRPPNTILTVPDMGDTQKGNNPAFNYPNSDINANTTSVETGFIVTPLNNPVTISQNIAFVSGSPNYLTPADQARVINIGATFAPTSGVAVIEATRGISVSYTNSPIITVSFQMRLSAFGPGTFAAALANARFAQISNDLQSQGVPAGNIIMGTVGPTPAGSTVRNIITFSINSNVTTTTINPNNER